MPRFTTDMLEPPSAKLSPEAALEWLSGEYVELAEALRCGYSADDNPTRSAFEFCSYDLAHLHEAAVAALKCGATVSIVRGSEPGRECLEQIVSHWYLDETGGAEAGFRRFGEMLLRCAGEASA